MPNHMYPRQHQAPRVIASAVVTDRHAGLRLDQTAANLIDTLASRKAAYKAAKAGRLHIDGCPAAPNTRLRTGMRIDLLESNRPPPPVYALTVTVQLEDDALAVVEKPPGIPVSGNYPRTVERALPHNLAPSTRDDALPWPRPVHRLDTPTGGLLLISKTASAMVHLGRQFEARQIGKRYAAIVSGRLDGRGCIEKPIDERPAVTEYAAVEQVRSLHTDWLTRVELRPVTGRTHQLRRHLAAIGHPIAGDGQYGVPGRVYKGKGLFLWAVYLEFTHPETGERITTVIEPPPKFGAYLAREQRRWQQY